jgi:hypothetical protein
MDCRALKRLLNVASAVALMGASVAAYAQRTPEDNVPPPEPGPTEQPPAQALPPCPVPEQPQAAVPPPPVHHKRNIIFAPNEVGVTTGAGAANYFGSNTPESIDAGAGWDARLSFGQRSIIGLEAAYMGAVNNVNLDQPVGPKHGQLFSNGFDTDLRLALPTKVQPYIFGGVGYNHIEVRNQGTGVANGFAGTDDTVTVPAGGGLTVYAGRHFNVDARGTYRFMPTNDITVMGTGNIHQWLAQAHVGYVF